MSEISNRPQFFSRITILCCTCQRLTLAPAPSFVLRLAHSDNAARPKWGPTAGLQRKHFQRILQDFPLADGSTATAPQLNALYEFVAGAGSDELSFSAFCYCILALWDKVSIYPAARWKQLPLNVLCSSQEPAKGVLQQAVLLQRSSD